VHWECLSQFGFVSTSKILEQLHPDLQLTDRIARYELLPYRCLSKLLCTSAQTTHGVFCKPLVTQKPLVSIARVNLTQRLMFAQKLDQSVLCLFAERYCSRLQIGPTGDVGRQELTQPL
jgi:hypothetical protein